MRGERQMNKNSQRLEDGASGSPYVNRYQELAKERRADHEHRCHGQ